jgi:hypothetical protein
MRVRTKSACAVLAWGILLAAGTSGPISPPRANTGTARITEVITLASPANAATVDVTAARATAKYVVQPGDTLSGIAARLDVRGGWRRCTRPTGRPSARIRMSLIRAPP